LGLTGVTWHLHAWQFMTSSFSRHELHRKMRARRYSRLLGSIPRADDRISKSISLFRSTELKRFELREHIRFAADDHDR